MKKLSLAKKSESFIIPLIYYVKTTSVCRNTTLIFFEILVQIISTLIFHKENLVRTTIKYKTEKVLLSVIQQ